MCTLFVASRVWEEEPLLVAANRDERLDRPAAPPERRTDGPLPVFAPRDLQGGGTWLGLNARGVFAGVTNRFGPPRDPARRSRGVLVLKALCESDAASASARVAALRAQDYNAFHLLVADRERAYLVWSDGASLEARELGAGLHVLTERSLGAGTSPREALLATRGGGLVGGLPPGDRALTDLLSVHTADRINGTCIHTEEYGTRSSTVLRLGRGARVRLLHAEGPPCSNPYADLSREAQALLE